MRIPLSLAAIAAVAACAVPVFAASNCEDGQGRSQADPFGACENSSGDVSCGNATETPAPGVHYVAPSENGAAVCIDDELPAPLEGRYGVANRGGRVSAYADLGDSNPARSAVLGTDWTRADVDPRVARTCVYRGSAGSGWLSGSGHDPSAEQTGEPLLTPLDPVTAPAGGNPARGLGEDGFSQCFGGVGVPEVPSVPEPGPLPSGVPSGLPSIP